MSGNARHICFFLDYLSLSWYSFGVGIVYHAYSFDQYFFNTFYSRWFITMTTLAALLCTTLSCKSRFIQNLKCKKVLRIAAFVVPYVTVSLPLVERILHCNYSYCNDPSIYQHTRQFFWAAVGIFLYATHIPECISPGSFDIIGHSHQVCTCCLFLNLS